MLMVVPNIVVVRPSEPRMTATPNYVTDNSIWAHPQSWVGGVVVMEIALAGFLWASVVW